MLNLIFTVLTFLAIVVPIVWMVLAFVFFVIDEIWSNMGWAPHSVKLLPGGFKDGPEYRVSPDTTEPSMGAHALIQ
jgi:hypothetical protein